MKPFHDLHKRIKQEKTDDMYLRDYFAIHATDYDICKYQFEDGSNKQIMSRAKARYKFADEMMEIRG